MNTTWKLYQDCKQSRDYSRVIDFRSFNAVTEVGVNLVATKTTGVAFDKYAPALVFNGDLAEVKYAINTTSGLAYFVDSAENNNDGTTTLTMSYDIWTNSRGFSVNNARLSRSTIVSNELANIGTPTMTGTIDNTRTAQTGGTIVPPAGTNTDFAVAIKCSCEIDAHDTQVAFIIGYATLTQIIAIALKIFREKEISVSSISTSGTITNKYQINNFFSCQIVHARMLNGFTVLPTIKINGNAVEFYATADDPLGRNHGVTVNESNYVAYLHRIPFDFAQINIGSKRIPMPGFTYDANDNYPVVLWSRMTLSNGLESFVRFPRGESDVDVTSEFSSLLIFDADAAYKQNQESQDIAQTVVSGFGALVAIVGAILACTGVGAPAGAGAMYGGSALAVAGAGATAAGASVGVANGIKGITATRQASYVGKSTFESTAYDGITWVSLPTSNQKSDLDDYRTRGKYYSGAIVTLQPIVGSYQGVTGRIPSGSTEYYQYTSCRVEGVPRIVAGELERILTRGIEVFTINPINIT